jgi:peptidoglycan/xylan/chitin deacetylase (PgdA/CDA1 family)
MQETGAGRRKGALVRTLAGSSRLAPVFAPLLWNAGTIFMLHRFTDRQRGSVGHDPELLRRNLESLRKERRELVSVAELARRCRDERGRVGRAVAFTVDDGYGDFASVAAPIFAEFDCPVTVFLVTGAIDEGGWYWWDRVTAAFEASGRNEAEVEVAGETLRFGWSDDAERIRAEALVTEALKQVKQECREEALNSLLRALGVSLPAHPPPRFAPMTWREVRACAKLGATFGPHTVTHPVLSQIDGTQAQEEIEGSWQRIQAETGAAVKVFAYPNGKAADYTIRDMEMLRQLGFAAAVTAMPDYVTARARAATEGVFQIPRFGYPDSREEFVRIACGLERLRPAANRARAAAAWLSAWWPEIG